MTSEQDSVQRLAEAEAHALRALAEGWAEEHYLHDSVGAFEAGWEARQPSIDSLTAERDEGRRVAGNLLARIFRDGGHRAATYETLGEAAVVADLEVANLFARAEAAEAEVKRLREALERAAKSVFPYSKPYPSWAWCSACSRHVGSRGLGHTDTCWAAPLIAALATPPSEGGQL